MAPRALQKLSELLDGQSSAPDDLSQCTQPQSFARVHRHNHAHARAVRVPQEQVRADLVMPVPTGSVQRPGYLCAAHSRQSGTQTHLQKQRRSQLTAYCSSYVVLVLYEDGPHELAR